MIKDKVSEVSSEYHICEETKEQISKFIQYISKNLEYIHIRGMVIQGRTIVIHYSIRSLMSREHGQVMIKLMSKMYTLRKILEERFPEYIFEMKNIED